MDDRNRFVTALRMKRTLARLEEGPEAVTLAAEYRDVVSGLDVESVKELEWVEALGGCPHCGRNDGHVNVGRDNWFFCKTHRTMWCIGNIFSDWKWQTEKEQREIYEALGAGEFSEVRPI